MANIVYMVALPDSAPNVGGASTETLVCDLLVDFTRFSGTTVKVGVAAQYSMQVGSTGTGTLRHGGTKGAVDGTVDGTVAIGVRSGNGYGLDYIFGSIEATITRPTAPDWVKLTYTGGPNAGNVAYVTIWVRES